MKIKIRRIFKGFIHMFAKTSVEGKVEVKVFSGQKEFIAGFSFEKLSSGQNFFIAHPLFLLHNEIELTFSAEGEEELVLHLGQRYIDPHNFSNWFHEEELAEFRKKGPPKKLSFGCTDLLFSHPYEYFKENPQTDKPLLLNLSKMSGIGDALNATPTIKKLAGAYEKRISIVTRRPEAFFNNPNVDKIFLTTDSFATNYKYPLADGDIPNSKDICLQRGSFTTKYFDCLSTPNFEHVDGVKEDQMRAPFPLRYTNYEAVEMYSTGLGFMLLDEEKTIEYRPYKTKDFNLDGYVVCNISASTGLRFWGFHEWNALFRLLKQAGLKVAVIGYKDYNKDGIGFQGVEDKGSIFVNKQDKIGPVFKRIFKPNEKEELDTSGVLDLTQTASNLNDVQQIIEQSKVLVTINTDTLHLCGSTDTWLILLGGAQHPELIMPHRYGSKDYKAFYVRGSCGIHCDSQLDYSIKHFRKNNWPDPMQCKIHVDTFCMEFFDEPKCHPKAEQVFEKIKKIYNI